MPAGIPSSCPVCGSNRVGKEYYLGSQTGDWVCGNCGHTDGIKRSEYPSPKPKPEEDSE